jgi:DNA-binding transcriptional MerR regulator
MNQSEAAKFTGVPQPTVSRWLREGIIRPGAAPGRGGQTSLTADDIMAILTIEELRRDGAPFYRIREAVKALRETYGKEWPYRWLMLTPEGVVVWLDEKDRVRDAEGQTFWADVAGIRERVERELKEAGAAEETQMVT